MKPLPRQKSRFPLLKRNGLYFNIKKLFLTFSLSLWFFINYNKNNSQNNKCNKRIVRPDKMLLLCKISADKKFKQHAFESD